MGFFSKFLRKEADDIVAKSKQDIIDIEKIDVKMSEFNISDLLEDIANIISLKSNYEEITILFETDKDIPSKIIGDRKLLGIVLLNLMENAIDFTEKGEVRLKIERRFTNLNEIHLRFKVIDTGIGIHPEALKEILMPFFKGEIDTLAELDIEGSGLFNARQILKKMKGKLSVSSEESKGSTFTADVSLFTTDPLNKRYYRLPEQASRRLKIKIFDVDQRSAEGLKKMFEYFRHDVSVPILQNLHSLTDIDDYDLIIIPDKFFNETMVAQMKEAKSKTNMELIIISERNAEMRDIAVQLADGQIEKPFNQQMIYELLVDLSAVNPA